MSEKHKAPHAAADMSVEELKAALAAKEGAAALEGFADAQAEAAKSGFKSRIEHAFNGGQPALRVDY